jgi:fatty acid desaturase
VLSLEENYKAMRERVRAEGLYTRDYGYYFLYSTLILLGTALSLYLITISPNPLFQALNGIFLAFVLVQAGMLGHDAAHGQVFQSRKANRTFSTLVLSLFGGLSESYWHDKHTAHHTHVNHTEGDPDLDLPFSFSEKQIAGASPFVKKYILPYQHVFFFLALPFIYTQMLVIYNMHTLRHFSLKSACEIALIGVHFVILFFFLFSYLPLISVVTFLVAHIMVSGIYLSMVFAPNHKGQDVVHGSDEATWRHQIELTRNLFPSPLIFHLCGGLNFQIEHHLFPNLPRPNYWRVQPLVKKFCEENNIEYYETTWRGSVKEIYTALKQQADHSRLVS